MVKGNYLTVLNKGFNALYVMVPVLFYINCILAQQNITIAEPKRFLKEMSGMYGSYFDVL